MEDPRRVDPPFSNCQEFIKDKVQNPTGSSFRSPLLSEGFPGKAKVIDLDSSLQRSLGRLDRQKENSSDLFSFVSGILTGETFRESTLDVRLDPTRPPSPSDPMSTLGVVEGTSRWVSL